METTKHPGGRPPKYKTPEELAAKAEGYFKYCDENPIRIYTRKNAGASQTADKGRGVKQDEGEMFVERPYTLDGLSLWCDIGNWYQWKSDAPDEFRSIINTLEARVRDRQVTGALVKVYDSNLTARLNGLADVKKHDFDEKNVQTATQAIAAILGIEEEELEDR